MSSRSRVTLRAGASRSGFWVPSPPRMARGAQPSDVQIAVSIGVDTRAFAERLPAILSRDELSFEICGATFSLVGTRERALDADE